MKTIYYLASSKKEAVQRAYKDEIKNPEFKVYKRMSKGNTLYKLL